jgi:tRNA 2-thiouridine synthesizing protein A
MSSTDSSTNTLAPNTIPEHLVDARGLNCPLPLLRLRQALHQRAIGEQLRLLTTDPISQQDIRRYCELSGQILLAAWTDPAQGFFGFDLQKTH